MDRGNIHKFDADRKAYGRRATDSSPNALVFNLEHLEDEDLKAIFVYLQSLKPVKNLVPAPIPPSQLKTK